MAEESHFEALVRTQAAFLRYLQGENGCEKTGKGCREYATCGCFQELQGYYNAEPPLYAPQR
jgi:hypothetical protein